MQTADRLIAAVGNRGAATGTGFDGTNSSRQSPTAPPPDYSGRQKIIATSGEVAHQCMSLIKNGLYGGFQNSCAYKVNYGYCAVNPKKDAWTSGNDCANPANVGGGKPWGP